MDLSRVLADLEDLPRPDRSSAGYGDGVTLGEVAAALGVTQERVRQIERNALRKCARWCESHGYPYGQIIYLAQLTYVSGDQPEAFNTRPILDQ